MYPPPTYDTRKKYFTEAPLQGGRGTWGTQTMTITQIKLMLREEESYER